jgi:hypothetical protein
MEEACIVAGGSAKFNIQEEQYRKAVFRLIEKLISK